MHKTRFKTETANRLNHTLDLLTNNYTELIHDGAKTALNNITMSIDEMEAGDV